MRRPCGRSGYRRAVREPGLFARCQDELCRDAAPWHRKSRDARRPLQRLPLWPSPRKGIHRRALTRGGRTTRLAPALFDLGTEVGLGLDQGIDVAEPLVAMLQPLAGRLLEQRLEVA